MNTYFELTPESARTLGLTKKFTKELISVINNYPRITWKVEEMLSFEPEVMKDKRTLATRIREIIGY